MIRVLFIILLASSSLLAFSQDLIVRTEGDSINCKITKVKKENIYFTFKHKDEIRSTLLPVSQVKTYKVDYYNFSEVPKDKMVGYQKFDRFRIAVNGGFSSQIGKVAESVPVDFKDYVNELKSGYHWGGDITYFFTEPMGCGLKYSQFLSSNSMDDIYIEYQNGNREYGDMSDNVKVTFLGPMFSTRFYNRDKSKALMMNLALGFMTYHNDKIMVDSYTMTGSAFGSAMDIGYDIALSKKLMLGVQLSLVTGTMSTYDWDDGTSLLTVELEKGEYESLSRFDFSVGLRFR